MQLLFIAPLPPPISGHSLASEIFLKELINKYTVNVVNLSKKNFRGKFKTFKRLFEILQILKNIYKKKKGAQVVYLTISESAGGNLKDLLIYLICFRKLSKMYIHLHGGSIKILLFDRYKLLRRINKFFISRLAGAIVLGQSHVDIFTNMLDPKKIYIVPNFAQDDLFASPEEIIKKLTAIQPLKILFLTNLLLEKGYNELVDAYIAMDDHLKKNISIDFAGRFDSESLKKAFLEKIKNVENIHYHGVVEKEVKKELLHKAHILCLPSSYLEGQPISILEAYAAGCVVLTTTLGGIKDIFTDGVNGYKIEERSSKAIQLVIEQIIQHSSNLAAMGMNNRKIAHEKYRTFIYNNSLKSVMGL